MWPSHDLHEDHMTYMKITWLTWRSHDLHEDHMMITWLSHDLCNCAWFDVPMCLCRGHNELDNPSLTQPLMYKVVDNRPSVPDLYAKQLEVCACVHMCMCVWWVYSLSSVYCISVSRGWFGDDWHFTSCCIVYWQTESLLYADWWLLSSCELVHHFVSPFHSPSHTSIPFCESYLHSNLPVLLPFHSAIYISIPFSASHTSIPFCQSYFHSILPVILPFQASHLRAHWSGMQSATDHITVWDTGT